MPEAASEPRRILDLLAAGQISTEEASELLEALRGSETLPGPPAAPQPPKPRGIARQLHIRIETDGDDGAQQSRISVNVPLGLAKFAGKLLPADAKEQLERQGIDLGELLASLDGDIPEGPLVDIEAREDDGAHRAKLVIEVI